MPRRPEVLFLLLLLLILVPVLVHGFRSSLRTLKGFYGTWRAESLREAYLVKYFFAALGILIIFCGLVLALAGFHGEKQLEIRDYRGADIVFALDISRSMLCEDVEPNRLERAAAVARGIVEHTPEARFGIVVFKGEAVKTIPVTEDTAAINAFLDILSPVLLSAPGSNVQAALSCAGAAFPDLENRRKIIILLSDGESLSGDAEEAALMMEAEDIQVITLGVGTDEGGPIPLADGEFVLDASGRQVITRMNRDILVRIAEQTSGEFLPVTDASVISRISRLTGEVRDSPVFIPRDTHVYRGFLLVSLAGFVLFLFVKVKRWKNLH